MKARIFLVRHGLAAPPGVLLGSSDAPLRPEGRVQMRTLARELSAFSFNACWCSPLARARESAALLLEAGSGHVSPLIIDELREISLGEWEGKNAVWIRENYPDIWQERGRDFLRASPPSGESIADLAARVLPAFEAIAAQARRHPNSLVVAHQAVNRVILAHISRRPLADIRAIEQPPAACTVLELDEDAMRVLQGAPAGALPDTRHI